LNIILKGVVGSIAYGLDTSESDVDTAGIFAVDTTDLFKLTKPVRTIETKSPDSVMHEAEKFCALAKSCNPSVLELLWLGHYEQLTPLGSSLIVIRNHFLSAKRVKDAYLGYATQQLKRNEISTLGMLQFTALDPDLASYDTEGHKRKIAKRARHVARLLYQGYQLYRTSTLPVKLPNAGLIREIGVAASEGDTEPLRRFFASYEAKFNANPSALPEQPDTQTIDSWLHDVRMNYLPSRVTTDASWQFPHA